jgi:hypothetical protein
MMRGDDNEKVKNEMPFALIIVKANKYIMFLLTLPFVMRIEN